MELVGEMHAKIKWLKDGTLQSKWFAEGPSLVGSLMLSLISQIA